MEQEGYDFSVYLLYDVYERKPEIRSIKEQAIGDKWKQKMEEYILDIVEEDKVEEVSQEGEYDMVNLGVAHVDTDHEFVNRIELDHKREESETVKGYSV